MFRYENIEFFNTNCAAWFNVPQEIIPNGQFLYMNNSWREYIGISRHGKNDGDGSILNCK